jgi:2-polyprenyl-3-methyl-5-hydroxy-6-metoxy-1,4-benzoquinol methylase
MDLREIRSETFERHPWERARSRFFLRALDKAGVLARPTDVLDVGAGDGFFADELGRRLPEGSRVVCCDSNYTDEHLARLARTVDTRVVSFVRQLPQAQFGLLMLLDVIEHVPDDGAFVRELTAKHLRPDGFMLVSVPAWMSLFTRHDLGVAHYRRYRPAQLVQVISAAGLTIRASGGLFHSLLVPRALEKLRERARGIRSVPMPESPPEANSDIGAWRHGPALTRAIDWALAADNAISAASAKLKVPLPGLSTWVLAQRQAV